MWNSQEHNLVLYLNHKISDIRFFKIKLIYIFVFCKDTYILQVISLKKCVEHWTVVSLFHWFFITHFTPTGLTPLDLFNHRVTMYVTKGWPSQVSAKKNYKWRI